MQKLLLIPILLALLFFSCTFETVELSEGKDTGLKRVSIDIKASDITSKEDYEDMNLSILESSGSTNLLSGSEDTVVAKIRIRGNQTSYLTKKPYAIKLDTKTLSSNIFSSLTTGSTDAKIKKINLLANALDPTMLRNDIAYAISGDALVSGHQMLPFAWTTNHEFVDLYLGGLFNGTYLMTDHVQNVAKNLDFEYEETGGIGFLATIDAYYDEEPKFHTSIYDMPVMVKLPDWEDVTYTEAANSSESYYNSTIVPYIQSELENRETTIMSGSWDQIEDEIDVESFALFWLITNIMENRESEGTPKSVYLYEIYGGDKLHIGPVWDFDYNTLNSRSDSIMLISDWYYAGLMAHDEFRAMLKNYWYQLRENGYVDTTLTLSSATEGKYEFVTCLEDYIDERAEHIRKSWKQNEKLWDTQAFWPEAQFQTFQGFMYGIKRSLSRRALLIDGYMESL